MAVRNVPDPRSDRNGKSANNEPATCYVLRTITDAGAPGEVMFSSDVIRGSFHPVWPCLPQHVTDRYAGVARIVFSLYAIVNHHESGDAEEHCGVAQGNNNPANEEGVKSPQASAPGSPSMMVSKSSVPLTNINNGGEASSNSAGDEEEQPALARMESTVVVPPRRAHSQEGEVDEERDDQLVETTEEAASCSVNSLRPLIVETLLDVPAPTGSSEEVTKEWSHDREDGSSDRRLIFETILDFTRMEYVSKHLSTLYDVPHLPVHLEDNGRPFTILVKCFDGVFFPLLEGTLSEVEARQAPATRVALTRLQNTAGAQNGTFLQPLDTDWDFVDGDAAREAELRQQRTESVTLGDIKTLAIASMTLRRVQDTLRNTINSHRVSIDALITDHAHDAEESARSAVSEATASALTCVLRERRESLEKLTREVMLKREQIAATPSELAEKQRILSSSPSATEEEEKELKSTKRTELQSILMAQRRRLLADLTNHFPISSSENSICGIKLPTAESQQGSPVQSPQHSTHKVEQPLIETHEHAIAVGHVCHVLVVYCRVFQYALPHPVILYPGRCRILERQGASEDLSYPLFPGRNSERPLLRRAMDLLRENIAKAASAIHRQNQAADLPLVMALEKLVLGR